MLQVRGVLALLMFAAFNIFWSALVLPLTAPPFRFSHTEIGATGTVGVIGALAAGRAGKWADRGYGQRTSAAASDVADSTVAAVADGMVARGAVGRHCTTGSRRSGAACHQSKHDFPYLSRSAQQAGRFVYAVLCAWQRFGRGEYDSGICARGMAGRLPAGASVSLLALLFWLITRG